MALIDPKHLFEQAEKLIAAPHAGPPRQVNLRRAISAAYYGVFHATLKAAADQYVGVTRQSSAEYLLVYRSVDHKTLRDLCQEIKKENLPARYTRHAPPGGFKASIREFASAVLELQEKRHAADYDPSIRIKSADAILAVNTARSALRRFGKAKSNQRRAFLSLLLFEPR